MTKRRAAIRDSVFGLPSSFVIGHSSLPPGALGSLRSRVLEWGRFIPFITLQVRLMKALILVADGFEDLELFCPWYRLQEEGVEVTLASPTGHDVTGKHGYRVETDMPIREVNPA